MYQFNDIERDWCSIPLPQVESITCSKKGKELFVTINTEKETFIKKITDIKDFIEKFKKYIISDNSILEMIS